MREIVDRDSLLIASSIVDLLDTGWRPGDAELGNARYVDEWAILPASEGIPFRMMGIAWSPPISCTMIFAAVIALDRAGRWARTWDEWVVIGCPAEDFPAPNGDEIRRASAAWLLTELRRWTTLA